MLPRLSVPPTPHIIKNKAAHNNKKERKVRKNLRVGECTQIHIRNLRKHERLYNHTHTHAHTHTHTHPGVLYRVLWAAVNLCGVTTGGLKNFENLEEKLSIFGKLECYFEKKKKNS